MRLGRSFNTASFSTRTSKHPILVLNAGSSSLKYKLFCTDDDIPQPQCHGKFERITSGNRVEYQYTHHHLNSTFPLKQHKYDVDSNSETLNYRKSVDILLNELIPDSISSLIVGHRVVHGGNTFSFPQRIDDDVLQIIHKFSTFAPLHNPYQLECIHAFQSMDHIHDQFVVFDTAFHSTISSKAHRYAISNDRMMKFQNEHGIELRRFGFHGISYQFIVDRVSKYFEKNEKEMNLIAVHLGSGCSICCIQNGISIETSMGFTPSEGLVMSTRSGDIDPGLLFAMIESEGSKDDAVSMIQNELNRECGLKGICGISDMREILENEGKDERCALALDVFCHRIKKYIGSYYALLNGKVDGLVFTGGIGENMPLSLIKRVVGDLDGLGFRINERGNTTDSEDVVSWGDSSSIPVLCIKTDEELAIAQQVMRQTLPSIKLS